MESVTLIGHGKPFSRSIFSFALNKGSTEFILQCMAILINTADLIQAKSTFSEICVTLRSSQKSEDATDAIAKLHGKWEWI